MRLAAIVILMAAAASAQAPTPPVDGAEERALREALAEAGNSPVEFARAIEQHLVKFPNSSQRADLERALVKAAVEARDEARVLKFAESVLTRDPNEPVILERFARALLNIETKESAEKALKWSRELERILRNAAKDGAPGRRQAQMAEEIERGLGRAIVFQARAEGNLGRIDEAIALGRKSYESYPTAEAAREIGRWLARAGKDLEAVRHYADAFTIPDARNSDAERARDRQRMGELYAKVKGSQTGLGDLVLEAYDRTAAAASLRLDRQREHDPNAQRSDLMEFTLPGLDGARLKLADLKGKVVVMDFWATWCGPCRTQHPLYEQVKQRFASRKDVVFLAISTDDDPGLVKPFLEANRWSKTVYFEGGLAGFLRVTSIPTTVIVNREGKVVSRMNGFLPERFVDMLTERIREAL